jgi:ubiquinone/menaquinone biosynthesis C-methylase UbiE
MSTSHYIIRGGIEGRERLRLLARVMQPTTLQLLERAGVTEGMTCLDVGCGGGDVTLDFARVVGPTGRAVGTDIDDTKLGMARTEAADRGFSNAEFQLVDAGNSEIEGEFDIVYSRFLLTHLPDPSPALSRMYAALRPGGVLIIEDIDFTGSFCYPENVAYNRYVTLYSESVLKRGGDPNIGPRLPGMLAAAGCEYIQMNVVQPSGLTGEAKLVTPLTMENIADAAVDENLAEKTEVEALVSTLYGLARDTITVMAIPRIVQAWGLRSQAAF